MPPFLYRCPNTGQTVQGFSAETYGDDDYEAITCLACRQKRLQPSRQSDLIIRRVPELPCDHAGTMPDGVAVHAGAPEIGMPAKAIDGLTAHRTKAGS